MQLADVKAGQLVRVQMAPNRDPYLLREGGFQGATLKVEGILEETLHGPQVILVDDQGVRSLLLDPSKIELVA